MKEKHVLSLFLLITSQVSFTRRSPGEKTLAAYCFVAFIRGGINKHFGQKN
jgi:hypothetical protein